MKIWIAFYKGKGDFVNKIVRWWTKSPYSHAELVLNDAETWLSISPFLKAQVSSRKKLQHNTDEWDFYKIDITKEQHDTIEEFYELTKGCGYDWIGMILSQFLPCRIKHKRRWYCSEWIAYALRISGAIDWKTIKIFDRCDLSPAILHNMLENIGYEKVQIG
jgi:hypothetical protein